MKNLQAILKGKKTYILAVCIGVLSATRFLGWVDDTAYIAILGLLGGGAAATLRAGMTK